MPKFEIYLLGSPVVNMNGRMIPLSRHKSVGLLAYLADTQRRVSRKDLSAIFWPDSNLSKSLSALRTVLSEIKSTLGSDLLRLNNDLISMDEEIFSCDINLFRNGLTQLLDINAMKKTESLWNGGFLKGFELRNCTQFSDWKFFEEQNLEIEYRNLLKKITSKLISDKSFEKALIYARKSLNMDYFDEETHREIMSLYAAIGNKTAALRQYKICFDTLKTEFGFPPEEKTQYLADQIRRKNVTGKMEYTFDTYKTTNNNIPRIAILTFIIRGSIKNTGPNPADILAESMTDYFTLQSNIEVISRTSTLSYKGTSKNLPRIAAELQVNYIIEGFIEILESTVIIESRLINASRDSVLFINREEVTKLPDNIAPMGTRMAMLFLEKLGLSTGQKLKNNQSDNTENDPGLPWRLHAKHLLRDYNLQNLELAMRSYNKAVEINPLDADAWAGIAAAYSSKAAGGMFGADLKVIYTKEDIALNKSLSINPDQPTALTIRGEISADRDRDYETAERYYKRALTLSPENPDIMVSYSEVLIKQGRFNESLKMAERSCELDPANSWTLSAKFWALVALKLYRKADLVIDEIYRIFPHSAQNAFSKAFIQLLLGKNNKFISILENIRDDLISEGMSTFLGLLAYAYATVGRTSDAKKLIDNLSEDREDFMGFHMPFASAYTAMGNFDLALDWLEKGEKDGDPRLTILAFIPFYKPLYNLPRFKELTERINITPIN